MKLLLIDNFDSFTYNLLHYLEMIDGVEVDVVRNDAIDWEALSMYEGILLSPGPGLPEQAGALKQLIESNANQLPILGICLGHQALGEFSGAKLKNLGKVVHGQSLQLRVLTDDLIFMGLPQTFKVGRYHSWVIDRDSLSEDWEITAEDEQGAVMAIAHKTLALKGVQFHPESILTEHGYQLLENWVESCRALRNPRGSAML